MVFILLVASQIQAQIGISTTEPINLTTCGDAQLFEITITNFGTTTYNSIDLTVDFPDGVIYEANSVTGLNVSELNVNNLNEPIFTLPNLTPNASINLSFLAKATCATVNNVGNFTNNIIINHSAGTENSNSTPYNIQIPSISITNTTNNLVNGSVGTAFTRSFTISNFGFGTVNELFFQDVHPAGVTVTGSDFGTLNLNGNTATITLNGADFSQIGNGDGFLNFGESITLTENFIISNCADGLSEISVGWGCEGEVCEIFSAFAEVIVESESPFLEWSYGTTTFAGLCESGSVELIIVNNVVEDFAGAAAALNIQFEPGLGAPNMPDELLRVECFDLSNFIIGNTSVTFDTVNYSGYGLDLSQFNTDPDGLGGLQDLDNDGQFDDLAAGDTIRLLLNAGLNPDCFSCESEAFPASTFRFASSTVSQCGEDFYRKNNNDFYTHHLGNTIVIADLDFEYENGDTIFLDFEFKRPFVGFEEACTNDSVTVSLTIPDGVTFEPIPAPTFGDEPIDYTLDGNVLTIVGEGHLGVITATFTTECDSSNFDFSLPCANANDQPNFLDFDYSIDYQCDSDTCTNPINLYCGNTFPFYISCLSPNDSDILGVLTDTFFADRVTLGWTDETLSQLVDVNNPNINLKAGISNDIVRLEIMGSVIGDEEFDNAYLRIFHVSQNDKRYFSYVSDTISFFDNETNQTVICGGTESVAVDTLYEGLFKMDIELEERFNTGCFNGLHLTEGDAINFVIYIQLADVALPTTIAEIPNFSAGFIFDFEEEELICKRKETPFNVMRVLNNLILKSPPVLKSCNELTLSNNLIQATTAPEEDIFPFEYRTSADYDSIVFKLPLGLNYELGSAELTYEFRTNNNDLLLFETATIPIGDPEISTDGDFFYLKFVNNNYPNVDFLKKNTRNEITFDLNYDCRLTPSFNFNSTTFYKNFVYSTNLPNPTLAEGEKNNPAQYIPPSRAFSAQQQTFETLSNEVFWTFDLCNTPNAQSEGESIPNNWIAFEVNNPTLDVTGLSEVTNPNSPIPLVLETFGNPGNFWVKVGTIDSLSCRTFQLNATFQDCQIDSVNMRSGFNCVGYPVDPDTGYEVLESNDILGDHYNCNIPELKEQLLLLPRSPDFQINLINAPSAASDLCQPLEYEFRILNTQIGPAFQLAIEINLPPGNGTTILAGTSEFKYPTDQPYQSLPEPTNIPGTNRYVWNLSDIDPSLMTAGLVGADKAPENEVFIKFQLLTNCDYIDGFTPQLTAEGINICNEFAKSTPFAFPPFLLNGFIPENEYFSSLSVSTIQPCDAPSIVNFSVINAGTEDSNFGQSIVVIMDQNFNYVPNSINNIQNFPNPIEPNNTVIDTIRVLKWEFPTGLAPGELLEISFAVETVNPDLLSCGMTDFFSQITQETTIDCTTEPQGFCELDLVIEQQAFAATVEFPDFIFNNISATSTPFDNENELITFDFDIINISDLDYSDSLTISIYEDTNGDGNFEENTDGLVNHYFLNDTTILMGDTAVFQFTVNVPNTALCQLLLVLSTAENACLCETQFIPVPFIQLENTIPNDTICVGESIVLGFDSADSYIYEWQLAGAFPTDISNPTYTFTGMLPDENFITETFILTTTRFGGCESSDTVSITTIQNNVSLEISDYNGADISCFGANDAFITATVESITDDFFIEWNTGDTTTIIDSLPPGTYTITVTDTENCKSIESVEIEEPEIVTAEINITTNYFGFDVQCFEGENGAVELLTSGGTGIVDIAWSTGDTQPILGNLTAGTYEVTITDVNDCSDTDLVNLTEPPPVVLEIQTVDNLCFGDEEGIIEIVDIQPAATYQFGLNCTNFSTTDFFPNLGAGDYVVCVQTTTDCIYENEITIEQPPELIVEILQDTVVFLGDPALLFAETTYPIDSISWSPAEFLNCENCLEVAANVLQNTTFTATVFDINGCEAQDAAIVGIDKNPRIYVPNVFSPNGDGSNDFLLIFANNGVEEITEFKIFSRWGALVFEKNNFQPNDPANGWDGILNGENMGSAVFAWYLKAKLIDGGEVLLKGDFTLIR